MAFSSFTIVMLSALAVGLMGIMYVRRTHRDALKLRDTRRDLLKKVESQPLPRMLQALGIGFGRFFYKLPVDSIQNSIAHCETCTTKTECDQKLKIPELNPEDIEFCNNREYLSQFSRAARIRNQQ